jgi:hypothetical protein
MKISYYKTNLISLLSIILINLNPMIKAATGNITTSPVADSSQNVIVAKDHTVTFTINAGGDTITTASGTFGGTDGTYDGPFTNSKVVTFGADAEGLSNTCTITVSSKGTKSETCSTNKVITFHVMVPKIKTETMESSTADSTRTTIGIGEQVECSILPLDLPNAENTTWDNSGSGTFDTPIGADVYYSAYSNNETDMLC